MRTATSRPGSQYDDHHGELRLISGRDGDRQPVVFRVCFGSPRRFDPRWGAFPAWLVYRSEWYGDRGQATRPSGLALRALPVQGRGRGTRSAPVLGELPLHRFVGLASAVPFACCPGVHTVGPVDGMRHETISKR